MLSAVIGWLFLPALTGGRILAPLDITRTLLQPWAQEAGGAKPHNHNPSDAVTQYLPYRVFAERSFAEDGYLGWNPWEMGGCNLASNTMALPGSWPLQLHRWLPFKDAWNLGLLAEFLTAGLGMLVFLRSRRLDWLPCLTGAVAFMLNAQFIVWIHHRWALGSFCWMPWLLWAATAPRPLAGRALLLPGFTALALLGGSLQHAAFVVLGLACIALGETGPKWWSPAARPRWITWSAAAALGAALAAFSLIPQVSAYFTNLATGHLRGGIGYPAGLSQPLLNLLMIPARIWPWLAGEPQTIDGWRILKGYFMDLNYIGTVPMLLALAGLADKRMPATAKWLAATGLVIPLTPLVGPLYHRVELLFVLGGSWMAAEMLAADPRTPLAIRTRRWLAGAACAAGVLLAAGTLLPASARAALNARVTAVAVEKGSESQFGADHDWLRSRALDWTSRFSILHPRTAWVFSLLLLGAAGLTLAGRNNPRASRAGQGMILAATTLELATLFQLWTTFSDPRDVLPQHPAVDTIRSLAGTRRVLQAAPGAGPAEAFAAPNLLASLGVKSIDGYESIQYPSPLILPDVEPADRLTLAGVALAIQPDALPPHPGTADWPVASTIRGFTLRRNPQHPPAVCWGAGQRPADAAAVASTLASATGTEPSFATMNRTTFSLPPGTDWVRIAQNWHEGWRWRIPGRPWKPLDRGPDAVCWIPDPPAAGGTIELRFFPTPAWLQATSLGALSLWATAAILIAIRGRHHRTRQPNANSQDLLQ